MSIVTEILPILKSITDTPDLKTITELCGKLSPYRGVVEDLRNVTDKACEKHEIIDIDNWKIYNFITATYSAQPIAEDDRIHVYMHWVDDRLSEHIPTLCVCSFHPSHPEDYKLQDINVPQLAQLFPENTLFGKTVIKYITEKKGKSLDVVLDALKAIGAAYECQLHMIDAPNPFADGDTWARMDMDADIKKLKALEEYKQRICDFVEWCKTN